MFVTLEGPEGSGKSTVAKGLESRLIGQGHTVVLTREPGAGPVGGRLRDVLLHGGDITEKCELFLFLADRAQHVETIVRPALRDGKVVLCDRHADSTVVYQGYARGFDIGLLREWNEFATGGLKPDLTLLLDLDVHVGLSRIQSKDRLDKEPQEFHEKVRAGFLSEMAREPDRWVKIDAGGSADHVLDLCWEALQSRL